MVRYRRLYVPGGAYFLTVALADRQATTLTDHIGVLRSAFRVERAARPFTIDAAVILPDHFHLLLTLPEGDSDFSTRLRLIKTRFTKTLAESGANVPRSRHGQAAVWQERFWEHCVRDETDYGHHVDYIHYNPVKHGLVACPADWPYSSLSRFIRAGLLPPGWGAPAARIGGEAGEPPQNRSPD